MERDEVLWMLESYEREVSWLPDNVNPYGEMDNILDGRDLIEDNKDALSEVDLARLSKADERVKQYASKVFDLLGRTPKEYREKYNVPRARWWWYVDELAKA